MIHSSYTHSPDLGYTQALNTRICQTAVCNRHHSVEQQLYRWLPLRFDWLYSSELVMTQELNRDMLGVRRELGVGRALATLLTLACSCAGFGCRSGVAGR